MELLHIALQKGFVQDSIILRANGDTILEKSHIHSQGQLGYAGEVEIHVEKGAMVIEVIIPSRTESKTIPLDISGPTYLGLSLTSRDAITHTVSERPFEYF